jgi:predicted ATPase
VEQLTQWCTDPEQRSSLTQRITHESGGNPFFAVTLLRGIERANTLRDDLCTWPPPEHSTRRVTLPDRIDSAITARVVELDERGRNVLAVATIGGGPAFDLDLISALTDLPLADVENALGAAERRNLVTFEGGRYVFSAAVIGEVLRREGLTRGMRQSLRRRAVDALASRTDLESRVLRAELMARVEPGPAVFEDAVRLTREAMGAGAARAANRAMAAAEEAAGKEPTGEQRKRIEELRRLST